MTYRFDLPMVYDFGDGKETVRVTGTITPGYPERGPSYDCGGTPAEPPGIEDFSVFRKISGIEVEVEDVDDIHDELYDAIMEATIDE